MAISKILNIKDCGRGYSGKHLKQSVSYITAEEKTGGGKWISAVNCQPEQVYEQMYATKERYGKTDKRQGYHLIISFVKGEADPDTAFEIIGKFTKEYLGKDYEAVYAVHNNTEHVHGHIIFNSVSFRTGRKFHYKKGDWEKCIQPLTNRLCKEYGLSTIEIGEDRKPALRKHTRKDGWRTGAEPLKPDRLKVPRIVGCSTKKYRRAGLSKRQKRYYMKLYQKKRLARRSYGRTRPSGREIKKMQELQEEYFFLSRHKVTGTASLIEAAEKTAEEKKEISREKSRIFKERAGYKPLFDKVEELESLKELESSYQHGEEFFIEEHERFLTLSRSLEMENYTAEQVKKIKEYYRYALIRISRREKEAKREECTARRLLREFTQNRAEEGLKRGGQKDHEQPRHENIRQRP